MANIRLMGLVLIITSLMLGLAAVATQTTTLRIGDIGVARNLEDRDTASYNGEIEASPGEVRFVSVPVAYPLMAACCLGLVLWFLPELVYSKKSVQFTMNRRRQRRR